MRVRAAGSSGVTTVNAVQTTAEGESGGGGTKGSVQREPKAPREGDEHRGIKLKREIGREWGAEVWRRRQGEGKRLTKSTEVQQAVIEANNNNIKQHVMTTAGQEFKSRR